MMRFRRTVLLTLVALLMGTAVARSAQDPAVALPRPSSGVGAEPTRRSGAEAGGSTDSTAGMIAGSGVGAGTAPTASARAPAPAAQPSAPNASPPAGSATLGAAGAATAATPGSPSSPGASGPSGANSAGQIEEGASEPSSAPGFTAEPVQQSALGTVHAFDISSTQAPALGRAVRYSVEVEDGIAANEKEFAETVQSVLTDARGWPGADGITFVPVPVGDLRSGAPVDVRITLATPQLTARLCAPLDTTISQVSCWNGGRAVLNLYRWARGSTTFGADLAGYRTYLVNHEVGHGLGHRHQQCSDPGQPAPIMVQQTKSLEGCTPWPWPSRP